MAIKNRHELIVLNVPQAASHMDVAKKPNVSP